MKLARTTTAALCGIDARPVTVECAVSGGLPAFTIVGLPDRDTREAREVVRAAIVNSGFEFPAGRIVVNLAPAHLRKTGRRFDLAIAVAILAASGQIDARATTFGLLGDLTLTGEIRAPRGTLPAVEALARHDVATIIVHPQAHPEARAGAAEAQIACALNLRDVATIAAGGDGVVPWPTRNDPPAARPDLADLHGYADAIRALLVAAAGGHNVLIVGEPGSGATALARRMPGVLGDLREAELLEVARIHSAAGLREPNEPIISQRPLRAPHETISPTGLVGGGVGPSMGEVTLAHRGVLYLDAIDEMALGSIDALRSPSRHRQVVIERRQHAITFPADCLLIGRVDTLDVPTDNSRSCRLTSLFGLFDIVLPLKRPTAEQIAADPVMTTAEAARAVRRAREHLERADIDGSAATSPRTRGLARTVAALDGSTTVTRSHVIEALRLSNELPSAAAA